MKINFEDMEAKKANGKPLEILLEDIEEDPSQPRTDFNEEKMLEITESIKEQGVIQPVSVRRHQKRIGKWILNFGARRYRASLAAGKKTIPAFVDETFNEFKQVIENEQRDNLKPMELAFFIQKQLDQGLKKSEIAKKLGKQNHFVTRHLALISMPKFLEEIYRNEKCTSPAVLYELQHLYKKFPEKIEAWCKKTSDVTREKVSRLADQLKIDQQIISQKLRKRTKKVANKEIRNPQVVLEYGQEEVVFLFKEPLGRGFIWVIHEDGKKEEVIASQCKIKSFSWKRKVHLKASKQKS